MNIQSVFYLLNTNIGAIKRLFNGKSIWDTKFDGKKIKKIEEKCIEVMDRVLSINTCTVKQTLLFYRWDSSDMNIYQMACYYDMRQLRDYIEEKKLLSEIAMRRRFQRGASDLICAVNYNDLEFVRKRVLLGADVNTSFELYCDTSHSLLSIAACKGYVAMYSVSCRLIRMSISLIL
jgi:hypothetical protein